MYVYHFHLYFCCNKRIFIKVIYESHFQKYKTKGWPIISHDFIYIYTYVRTTDSKSMRKSQGTGWTN